jgi:maltose alpha-D-glucosyltransferase/alpha-amylase
MVKRNTTPEDRLYWYKDAVIYELHIKAFCDSNGDGTGDFNGLISKLDYLQSLGVTAIWLLPFYPSPLRDDGYDIQDYYTINPSYGDLEQFKKFLDEAHRRNLKVITELVINHTSDQHHWFKRARQAPKGSPEREFYVWTDNPHKFREVRIIFKDFEASNWTWDPVAKQYYWHRFFHHQPDLNYDNPLVQEEIFKILDYWCAMGVDGFRLDAVPYLFEREGTNCENLPETHAFLKKLRKHVDEHHPGTLLLAEANMWPEDSAAYFGEGDECHMNYHFPVMPRMFMALQMEDRYPITDIFAQTPEIPENCQWAMFLRNHDELTLEMVTDEERDYMYKVYTKDPRARINLGIRHRLAPLLDNNRKKIELLNYLLFSLPGTPVIYYGDEIGMGDNFYLGDRDGVRTPMQWSADRNAGFSSCESYRLYLPVILDPAYHYESINVDVQTRNTSSLLWWMRRLIHTRKKYQAFSRGSMAFIHTDNPKILAFKREYKDEVILVIVNLSRYLQPVNLRLDEYAGYTPVEMFSKSKFPSLKEDGSFFTLGPYDCHWYHLQNTSAEHALHDADQALALELEYWDDLPSKPALDILENDVLGDYLMKMRWFGGKGRVIQSLKIANSVSVPLAENSALLILIEVIYQSGLPDLYQLALAFREDSANKADEQFAKAVIARIKVGDKEGVLFDASYEPAFQAALFRFMSSGESLKTSAGDVLFSGSSMLKDYAEQHASVRSKVLSAEQSNTSVVYDEQFFLKLYRKVDRSINPDLELTHFLSETAGFKYIPAFAGAIRWKFDNGTMVLGMMQELVPNNGDSWTYVLERLEHYYERALSQHMKPVSFPDPDFSNPVDYDDMPQEIKELIHVSFADQIELLGKRTGEMHIALASDSELPDFAPEEFSLHYQRSLFSGFQSLVTATFENQEKNLHQLPDHLRKEAKEITGMRHEILNVLKRIYAKKIEAMKIRIHGDYHLGQVLYTGNDFVILDFEGEPARPYSERRLKRSPLRDVAGMIRSFHYAAYGCLFRNDHFTEEDMPALVPFAEQWYNAVSNLFMKAYLDTVKGCSFIPEDKNDLNVMMETYILEKAVYELNYELNNRPDWVVIPYRGIQAIMKKHKSTDIQ